MDTIIHTNHAVTRETDIITLRKADKKIMEIK